MKPFREETNADIRKKHFMFGLWDFRNWLLDVGVKMVFLALVAIVILFLIAYVM